jgi:head-tail adaptor
VPNEALLARSRSVIDAGKLNRRVDLLSPVYNDSEDEIVDWAVAATVWAEVIPESGTEVDEAGRIVAVGSGLIIIRARPGIDKRWRVRDGSHLWEVLMTSDTLGRGVALRLTVKEVE